MEFDARSVSFKRRFISNLFACNLIIGCSKKRLGKFFPKRIWKKEVKKPGLKSNPGLALVGLLTTGPWTASR